MPAHTPIGAEGPKGEAELASLRRGPRRRTIQLRRDGEGAGWGGSGFENGNSRP